MAWDGSLWKKSIDQRAKILLSRFQSGDTDAGIRFTLGGLYKEGEFYRNISEAAYLKMKALAPDKIMSDRVVEFNFGSEFRVEHVIPISSVHKALLKRKGKLTVKYIQELIEKRLCCAVITKEEDIRLGKVCHLKSKMPLNWDFDTGDVFARYEVAGIKLHQWGLR